MKGTSAIVTGAASGIGRAVALELVKSGLNVCLFDLCEQGLNQTEEEIRPYCPPGVATQSIQGDVTSSSDVTQLFHQVHERFQNPAQIENKPKSRRIIQKLTYSEPKQPRARSERAQSPDISVIIQQLNAFDRIRVNT